jgi:acyl-CoA synthetase (AMP-forming)/AMP-acid ligase II
MGLLFDWLRADAERFPDKPAALFAGVGGPEHQITFAELDDRSDRVAAFLADHGIGAGDRVAMLYDNSMAALCWFWGVLKTGAATVDVPVLAGMATIQGVLDEAAPKAIAIDPRQLHKATSGSEPLRLPALVLSTIHANQALAGVPAGAGLSVATLAEILASTAPRRLEPNVTGDDVALIVYTSGTTGRPNGVMLSHDNFISNLTAANELMGLGSHDSILVVVPLYYIHGRMQLLLHAMLGGTLVFSAGFQFPQKVLQELVEFGTTGLSGVPYHFKQLLDRSKLTTTDLPELQYVLITGGALSPAELERLQDALPGVDLHLAYGQTEAAPRITWIGPDDLFVKEGSVGRALPGVELELLGRDEQPVGPGEIGEVVAGGPNIMKGYVSGDHVALGKIDAEGRLRTGDLGRLDEDGHLFLVGRSSEMIKSAGERIFPQEIEAVVLTYPGVLEVAVVGLPDPILGERVVAYVVVDGTPPDTSQLKAHCLQSLPFVRVPKAFELMDELPKTGSGKVNRGALRKAAGTEASEH